MWAEAVVAVEEVLGLQEVQNKVLFRLLAQSAAARKPARELTGARNNLTHRTLEKTREMPLQPAPAALGWGHPV